jgi:hypothetical protein
VSFEPRPGAREGEKLERHVGCSVQGDDGSPVASPIDTQTYGENMNRTTATKHSSSRETTPMVHRSTLGRSLLLLLLPLGAAIAACSGSEGPTPEALALTSSALVPSSAVATGCGDEYVPPGYTSATMPSAGYYSVATVSVPVATTSMYWLASSGRVALGPLTPNLGYWQTTTPGEFVLDVQNVQGAATYGPAVGATVEVEACGPSGCGAPFEVTITDCSPSPPPSGGSSGGGPTCPSPTPKCAAGTKWNSASCECVRICGTPACACAAAGGDWDGHNCT